MSKTVEMYGSCSKDLEPGLRTLVESIKDAKQRIYDELKEQPGNFLGNFAENFLASEISKLEILSSLPPGIACLSKILVIEKNWSTVFQKLAAAEFSGQEETVILEHWEKITSRNADLIENRIDLETL